MGNYQDQLVADMKAAMKAREQDRVQVLRMLINGLKEEQLRSGRDELEEAEEVAVLRKAVKARRDAVAQAEDLGRADIADSERAEIGIIEAYLPSLITGAELEEKVRELAAEIGYSGPKDTGKFMKEWMARYKGRSEGRDVQAVLKTL